MMVSAAPTAARRHLLAGSSGIMILVLGVAFFNSAPRGRLPGGAGASLQRISARAVLGLQSSTADAADSTEKQKDVAGDAEIERLCASYKVPQPPPFRPELAARAAEAMAAATSSKASGVHADPVEDGAGGGPKVQKAVAKLQDLQAEIAVMDLKVEELEEEIVKAQEEALSKPLGTAFFALFK